MVLLENFGAEPFTIKLRQSNGSKFVVLLPRTVTQPMMPGVSKFRKEGHPERAQDNGTIFSHFLNGHLSWMIRIDKRRSIS